VLRVDLCKDERKERCRADNSCVLKIVPFSMCKSFKKLVERLKRKIDLKYAE